MINCLNKIQRPTQIVYRFLYSFLFYKDGISHINITVLQTSPLSKKQDQRGLVGYKARTTVSQYANISLSSTSISWAV